MNKIWDICIYVISHSTRIFSWKYKTFPLRASVSRLLSRFQWFQVVFDFGGSDFSDVARLVAVAWVLLVICGFYVGGGG